MKHRFVMLLVASLCCMVGGCASSYSREEFDKGLQPPAASAGVFTEDSTKLWPIKLDRPEKIGDVYNLQTALDFAATGSRAGEKAVPQTHDQPAMHYELDGRVTVTGIDLKGREDKVDVSVDRLIGMGKSESLLPLGTVAHVDITKAQTQATLNSGQAVGQDASDTFMAIYSPDDPDAPTNDEMGGTASPRHVGESWPVNAKAVVKEASEFDMSADPSDVDGQATLQSVEIIDGVEAMRVSTSIFIRKLKLEDAPFFLSVKKAGLELNSVLTLPTDPNLPEMQRDATIDVRIVGSVLFVPFRMDLHIHQVQKTMPVK